MAIRRPTSGTLREVLKYSLKPSALLDDRLPLAPLIHGIKAAKLRAPWGTVRKALKAQRLADTEDKPHMTCECGAESWTMLRRDGTPTERRFK